MSTISATGFSWNSNDGSIDTLEADLARMVELGVDAVELSLSSVDLISGGRIIDHRLDQLAAVTGRFELRYTVHGSVSSNFMDPDTLSFQLAYAKALAQAAARVGAGILVHHGGSLRADQWHDRADADRRERDALRELAAFCQPLGVRVALENIFSTAPGQYRQTPSGIAATVRAVDHPNLVALIDFSHAYLEATYRGLDFRTELAAMAPVTGHLHVHDSFGRPQAHYEPYLPSENTGMGIGDLHLPLGWGDIDWTGIFSELDFLPDTILMMEIGDRYRIEQAESLAMARQLMALKR